MDYGKIIKEYREKNLLSQQEFADLLGVSVITNFEMGTVKIFSYIKNEKET